jgi:predicted sulfurtransferase
MKPIFGRIEKSIFLNLVMGLVVEGRIMEGVLRNKLYLAASKYFKDIPDIDTKATMVDGHCFEKMIVKYRKEIVAL